MSNDTPTPPVTPEMIADWQTWLEVLAAGGGDSQDREDLLASFGRFALEHSPAILARIESDAAEAEKLRAEMTHWKEVAFQQGADITAKAALARPASAAGDAVAWRDPSTLPAPQERRGMGRFDLWIKAGYRIAGCYWDHICDEWRTTGNDRVLIRVGRDDVVAAWMLEPAPPAAGAKEA